MKVSRERESRVFRLHGIRSRRRPRSTGWASSTRHDDYHDDDDHDYHDVDDDDASGNRWHAVPSAARIQSRCADGEAAQAWPCAQPRGCYLQDRARRWYKANKIATYIQSISLLPFLLYVLLYFSSRIYYGPRGLRSPLLLATGVTNFIRD